MSQTIQTQTPRCNDCGGALRPLGINQIGRPVYECVICGDTQVGPFQ